MRLEMKKLESGHEKWCLADKKDLNFHSKKREVTTSFLSI